jgi:hypothetical protein
MSLDFSSSFNTAVTIPPYMAVTFDWLKIYGWMAVAGETWNTVPFHHQDFVLLVGADVVFTLPVQRILPWPDKLGRPLQRYRVSDALVWPPPHKL